MKKLVGLVFAMVVMCGFAGTALAQAMQMPVVQGQPDDPAVPAAEPQFEHLGESEGAVTAPADEAEGPTAPAEEAAAAIDAGDPVNVEGNLVYAPVTVNVPEQPAPIVNVAPVNTIIVPDSVTVKRGDMGWCESNPLACALTAVGVTGVVVVLGFVAADQLGAFDTKNDVQFK